MSAKKNILVTGATGKQGGSVINALSNHPDFVLLAVTRNATGAGARGLAAKASNICILQGDQNDVPALFRSAKEKHGALWGVYSVQVSEGPGASHEGEITQGKAMIDEALKAGVKHFVYSSVDRGGDEVSWETRTPIPHFQSKYEIERHLKEKAAGAQMGWTVLRPVAFMDNLAPGFQSKVFMAALRDTLGSKPMQWVATKDIGIFVKLAFEDPSSYNQKAIGLAGDELTTEQLAQAFKKKTGYPLEGTYWAFGYLLKTLVSELRLMINWFGSDGYGADIAKLKKTHPSLMNMETWIEKESSFPKA